MNTLDSISVCRDCFIALNCGDLYDVSESDRIDIYLAIDAKYKKNKISVFPASDGCYFSWRDCDCCERPLGGERHDMWIKHNSF